VSRAAALYDKLRLFVESMERLGRQIETAHNTYEEAMNRLVRGKGNVISHASRFSELGVAVKKGLPRTVTEAADMEGYTVTWEDKKDDPEF
jgi:DNA recombination protein RmuC